MSTPNPGSSNPLCRLLRLLPLLLLAASTDGFAASSGFGLRKDGKLDQSVLAAAYMESDWEPVTAALEGYLRRHGDTRVPLEERIFAYKYLGVIYAADSLTQSKSESYFNRLLDLSPKVEIFDLYPSKKVTDFFRETKREHQDRIKYAENFDAYGRETGKPKGGQGPEASSSKDRPAADAKPASSARPRSPQPVPVKDTPGKAGMKSAGGGWIWWTVGIAAAAGAGAYVVASQDPGTRIVKQPPLESPP